MTQIAVSSDGVHEKAIWACAGIDSRKNSISFASYTGVSISRSGTELASGVAVRNRIAVSSQNVRCVARFACTGSISLSDSVCFAGETTVCLVVFAGSASNEAASADCTVEVGAFITDAFSVHS
jgi:hypothetical protein